MPYAFNLTLDPESALAIERVYASLAAHDIQDRDLVTQYGPCVTFLIVSDGVHEEDIGELLARQLPLTGAMPVTMIEPCVIAGTPPTLSLRVDATDALLALHAAIFEGVPERAVHPQYRPALWQPHLKLANLRCNRQHATRLIRLFGETWKRLETTLDHVEVIQYPPAQSIWQAPLRRSPPGMGAWLDGRNG